jgi:hypothetical protein
MTMPTTIARARKPAARTRPLKSLYSATPNPGLVSVPATKYLVVDGAGEPGSSKEFQDAIQALFGLTYGAKFSLKREGDRRDYPVSPLEGLFWVPGWEGRPLTDVTIPPEGMHWSLMIAQPSFVTARLIESVRTEAAKKKPNPALARVRLERFAEGRAAQVLHVGSYDAEGPTIAKLHAFIAEQGLVPRGKHHEIYLNDPRRVGPARTRTIIRQPVAAP